MPFSISQALICFIVCHGGPADHVATFAQNMSKECAIEVYASGPALKKFQEREVEVTHPFSLDNLSSEEEDLLAEAIAKACGSCSIVMTDVGHPFDIKVQNAFAKLAPQVRRFAYYDNPEPYVGGGYSKIAAPVMLASQVVLFANSNLAQASLFQEPNKEVVFGTQKRIGVGYYPISHAEKIAKKRSVEKASKRHRFLSKRGIAEKGQKILVYFGGNNEEYFDKAFPAFLSLLSEAIERRDCSNLIFVLQQHPASKGKELDLNKLKAWEPTYGKAKNAPTLLLSDFNSDEAELLADAAFYYQTSMGAQFVLVGLPTIQIGHESFPDILVKNSLAPSITKASDFLKVIEEVDHKPKEIPREAVLKALGIKKNWLEIFKKAIWENVKR